jgi:hypothetical protein
VFSSYVKVNYFTFCLLGPLVTRLISEIDGGEILSSKVNVAHWESKSGVDSAIGTYSVSVLHNLTQHLPLSVLFTIAPLR